MLPHIFELFVQLDQGTTRSHGGLGIGLTLVKNLVEMHNGTVEARSSGVGRGSEFTVRLSRVHGHVSTNIVPTEARPRPVAAPSGNRLLVIDDNKDAANSLAMLLRLQGHEVQVAFSGVAALEIAKTFRPHLVFLDIGMPDMDGYEVAGRLRNESWGRNTVLVALTGWGQHDDRRRSAEAGFNHHLVKPLELNSLSEALSNLKSIERP